MGNVPVRHTDQIVAPYQQSRMGKRRWPSCVSAAGYLLIFLYAFYASMVILSQFWPHLEKSTSVQY